MGDTVSYLLQITTDAFLTEKIVLLVSKIND